MYAHVALLTQRRNEHAPTAATMTDFCSQGRTEVASAVSLITPPGESCLSGFAAIHLSRLKLLLKRPTTLLAGVHRSLLLRPTVMTSLLRIKVSLLV